MFGLKMFGAGLVLGGAVSLFATNYHVVQTNDGMVVLPRSSQPPLRSTYVDVRQWNLAMWEQHPEVAQAMVKSGRTDLMVTGAMNNVIPGQVAPTTLEKFGQSVSEKTREAYKSLVPIKFTNPDGQQTVLPEQTNDLSQMGNLFNPQTSASPPISSTTNVQPLENVETVLGESVSTIPTPPQYQEEVASTLSQATTTLQNKLQEVIPDQNVLPDNFKGYELPKLQNPIPIEDDPFEQVAAGVNEVNQHLRDLQKPLAESETKQTWVKGLLNSMVPQSDATQPAADYGQTPFKVDAPNPLDELKSQTSSLLQREIEQALPNVKPF